MSDNKLKIIDDLNSRRLLLKMSQQDLADATFMSKSTVSRALDPETGNPKIRDVVAMARAMDADLTIMTPETKMALENSDVTFYREAIIKAEGQIEDLSHQLEYRQKVIEDFKRRIDSYEKKEKAYEEQLESERRWGKRLVRLFVGVVVAFLIAIVLFIAIDLANGDAGWFQNVANFFSDFAASPTLESLDLTP